MTGRVRSPAVALGVGALVGVVVAGGGEHLAMRLIALADDIVVSAVAGAVAVRDAFEIADGWLLVD